MDEYLVVTTDSAQLRETLALSVVRKSIVKLTVSSSTGTRDAWFLCQQASSEGMDDKEVFFGLAGGSSDDPQDMSPARIEVEDSVLVLIASLS